MSDDTEPPPDQPAPISGQLINFPAGNDVTDRPPLLPDLSRLFPAPPAPDIPPESPEETTMELPAIPNAPDPASALRSDGIPNTNSTTEEGIGEPGANAGQNRSLADRLGDWLEFRLEQARARHEGEAAFREAEVARKVELLKSRTAAEVAMLEQNGKLRQALLKTQADKAGARGKSDAARSSSSGLGGDKGGRSKSGGGGGSRSGGGSSGGSGRGGGSGGGRGPGTNGAGGTGRGSGGGSSPKGSGKGSDRPSGGRGGPSKGNETSGGSRSRQNGSGGSGKSGSGKGGSSGSGGRNGPGGSGSGKGGSKGDGSGKGGSKGDSGRTQNPPASPRAERARGRQERAAARQAARHQRRSADQAARIADRSKDRDQDRTADQAAREERRRVKAERKAQRQAKREAAKTADGRTTLGAAVAQEAQRRWEKRRAAEKDSTSGKGSEATAKKTKDGPDPASDGPKDDPATGQGTDQGQTGGDRTADDQTGKQDPGKGPDGSGKARTDSSKGEGGWGWWKKRPEPGNADPDADEPRSTSGGQAQPGDGDPYEDLFGQEDPQHTTDRPDRPATGPEAGHRSDAAGPRTDADDDVVDAVIVDDPGDPFGADRIHQPGLTTGTPGLPPAPEPHTQRPGTTKPPAQEDPVASHLTRPGSSQAGMAARHRTDITFDEYLTEIVNIAISATLDAEGAQELAASLGRVAASLRDIAADLVGDHNVTPEVVDRITDLADSAMRMKATAERCAADCEIASVAASTAAVTVGRVYGQDIQAMDDAGLAHASAAAHHD